MVVSGFGSNVARPLSSWRVRAASGQIVGAPAAQLVLPVEPAIAIVGDAVSLHSIGGSSLLPGRGEELGSAGELDALIFFWDPLEPQPHDPDVKALLRIAVLYNIPTACNRATADFIVSSPLMAAEYERRPPDAAMFTRRGR